MAILSKTVIVGVSRNIKYYESLGYIIPKITNINNILQVKRGTTIEINVEHLTKGSHVKVLCQCDLCKKHSLISFQKVKINGKYICLKCANSTTEKKLLVSKQRKGKMASLESRQKMKEHSWVKGRTGKNHPNYNPKLSEINRYNNRRLYPGYNQWQKLVLERDNYICRKCGKTKSETKISAYHINNFANFKDQRTDISNGITLCKDCHKQIHSIYGKQTLKEHLDKFILEVSF